MVPSNKKTVTVSDKGKLTGRGRGAARVTASYKGHRVNCYLDITSIVYVKTVKLNKTSLQLSRNHGFQLKARLSPKNPDDPTVTWTSSNPAVAEVSESGLVSGIAAGRATITATSSNGKTAKCKVKVVNVNPKRIDFKKLYITLHPGETFGSAVKFTPENASDCSRAYASSNTGVATVDENGLITAVGCGTSTITVASTVNAKAKNTCKVCVIEPGAPRLAGLIIGINPGHQIRTITRRYPIAPGSSSTGLGVKTGASGRVTRQNEYAVVLQIGLKLKRILEAQGATVVITRTKNDVMLTNIARAKMLNRAGVDVALQLHNNSSVSSAHGLCGYVRTTGDWVAESKALSKAMCRAMSRTTGLTNNGLRTNNTTLRLNQRKLWSRFFILTRKAPAGLLAASQGGLTQSEWKGCPQNRWIKLRGV